MNIRVNDIVRCIVAIAVFFVFVGYTRYAETRAAEARLKFCLELKKSALANGRPEPECKS